jgi:hypothetical protein
MQKNTDVGAGSAAAVGRVLRCPNVTCAMHGQTTNLWVCRCCHRATVRSIYRPRTTMGFKRVTARAGTSLARRRT